ncbi:MAG: hypothetical protein ACRC3B_08645 [Bacteroidia bacterium]
MLGRTDKKFCSDHCRNTYNNKRNSDVNNLMRNINNILRRNRRILEDLIPDEKAIVSRDKLNDLGFNFSYITHTYTTRKGAVYHFCYEYGYLEIANDLFTLVRRRKGSQLSETA